MGTARRVNAFVLILLVNSWGSAALGTGLQASSSAETYVRYCSTCHPPSIPLERDKRCEEWKQTIEKMARIRRHQIGTGIPVSAQDTIAQYLSQHRQDS